MKSTTGRAVVPVTVVTPVYNERESIEEFLDALALQDPLPAEVVLVDGGSTDGTIEVIKRATESSAYPIPATLIVDPSCNTRRSAGPIARARNVGIAAAAFDIIVCTDAGCRVTSGWVGFLSAPLLRASSPVVAGGWYEPDARTVFERAVARVSVMPLSAVRGADFIPSSRSIGFWRTAWKSAGGYPEDSYTGEDTMFVLRLRSAGIPVSFVPGAIVLWRMRGTLAGFVKQVYRYGYGDGGFNILHLNVAKNIARLCVCAFLIVASVSATPWMAPFALVYLLVVPYLREPRALFSVSSVMVIPLAGLLKPLADSVYVLGYARGWTQRWAPDHDAAKRRR